MDTSDVEMFSAASEYITLPFKVVFTEHTRMIELDKSLTIQQMKNEIWPEIKRKFEINSDAFSIINSDDTETGEPISDNLDERVGEYFNNYSAIYIRFTNVLQTPNAQKEEYNREKAIYREANNIPSQLIRSSSREDIYNQITYNDSSGDDTEPIYDERPPSPPSPSLIRTVPHGNIITSERRPIRRSDVEINISYLNNNIDNYLNSQEQQILLRPEPIRLQEISRYNIILSDRVQYLIKRDSIIKIQRKWRDYLRADISTCPVCYDDFRFMSHNYECEHLLCITCFRDWSRRNQSCPVCRAVVITPNTPNTSNTPVRRATNAINRNILEELNREENEPIQDDTTPLADNIENQVSNINNNNPIDQENTQFGRGITEILDIITNNDITDNRIINRLLNEVHNRIDQELLNIIDVIGDNNDRIEDIDQEPAIIAELIHRRNLERENINYEEYESIDDSMVVQMPISMGAIADIHEY
jgi:hypothetical protein